MNKEAAWEYASDAWAGEGTAYRNRFSTNPVHHILTTGAQLWCSGSRGRSGVVNNLQHRVCPKCMKLALEMFEKEQDDD